MSYHDDNSVTRRDAAIRNGNRSIWVMGLLGAMLVLGIIVYMTGGLTTDTATAPTANNIPATSTTGKGAAQQTQGPTGTTSTGSGGAPASKPEGETPPDMQVKPPTPR